MEKGALLKNKFSFTLKKKQSVRAGEFCLFHRNSFDRIIQTQERQPKRISEDFKDDPAVANVLDKPQDKEEFRRFRLVLL